MSQAPSMPVFTDALIGDTTDLSMEEFGSYLMILFVTWRNNGKPLPDDDKRMARICRMSESEWSAIKPTISRYFDITEGFWRQKRLEKEWDFVQKRIEVKKANGKKGGRPKSLKDNETDKPIGSVEDNLNHNLNESTHTQPHTTEDYTVASATVEAAPPAPAHELAVVDKAKKPRRAPKVKSKLPKDWMLPMEWGQWAMGEGANEQMVRKAADRFKSHHVGSGTLKADWREIWCNWVRSDLERNSNVKQSSSSKSEDLFDGLVNAACDIMDARSGSHNVVPLRATAGAW